MSNILPFGPARQGRDAIREQACAWLVRIDAGLQDSEYKALQTWLAENPAHRCVLTEMAAFWDQASVLSELPELFPLEHYVPERGRKLRRRLLGTVAVSFLLVVLVGKLLFS